MSEFILYGIPNCDTVKKARKWFDAKGVSYRFHDFKKDGVDMDLLTPWLAALGPQTLINKRGTTWRKLDEAEQARAETDPAGVLMAHPSLIKRPVISGPHGLSVGFTGVEKEKIEEGLVPK